MLSQVKAVEVHETYDLSDMAARGRCKVTDLMCGFLQNLVPVTGNVFSVDEESPQVEVRRCEHNNYAYASQQWLN